MVRIRNLDFGYSRRVPLFQNLSLALDRGHIYGLLGKNGAGKNEATFNSPSNFSVMFSAKQFTILLALTCTSFVGHAQKAVRKAPVAAPAATVATPSVNTMLWEISGKGLAQPSYIYGTIHLLCPADLQVGEPLKQAFGKTQNTGQRRANFIGDI